MEGESRMFDVSEKALGEFKKVLEKGEHRGMGIKIRAQVAQSSCCSCGPSQSYEMDLVEGGDAGDISIERQGMKFYADKDSAELMKGFEVDFSEDHGFIVKDTNAPSCGCGDYGDQGGHGGSCCG
jgi:Fe-S cluster assembly iron-binding protein IscA